MRREKPEEINVFSRQFEIEELQQLRARLAKKANQRIRTLQKTRSEITGESYAEWGASHNAIEMLKRRGRHYFSESMKSGTDKRKIKNEILELQRFLRAESSTLSGAKRIESKRIATFESKGIHFSDTREFYDFLNSNTFESVITKGLESGKIVEAYDMAREKMSDDDAIKKINEALKEFNEKGRADIKTIYRKLGVNPLEK